MKEAVEKPCESLADFVTLWPRRISRKPMCSLHPGGFGEFLKEKAPKLRLLYEGFQNECHELSESWKNFWFPRA